MLTSPNGSWIWATQTSRITPMSRAVPGDSAHTQIPRAAIPRRYRVLRDIPSIFDLIIVQIYSYSTTTYNRIYEDDRKVRGAFYFSSTIFVRKRRSEKRPRRRADPPLCTRGEACIGASLSTLQTAGGGTSCPAVLVFLKPVTNRTCAGWSAQELRVPSEDSRVCSCNVGRRQRVAAIRAADGDQAGRISVQNLFECRSASCSRSDGC